MEGSSLSPRMSPELLECFKRHKVAISQAIKTTFPFLEGLRDNNFITSKMYEDFQESCRLLVPVQRVIYRALDELEKKFDIEVLHELFSAVNLDKYPDLESICRSFENVLPNGFFFYRHNGGEPNSQLSLEQGPSGSCSQRSLTWLPSGPSSSEGWRSNDRRNSSLIQGNQTENHQLSKSPNHLVSSLPEGGLSEDICENEHISRVRRDASTNTGNNTNEPERKPTILPRGPGSVPEDSRELQVQLNNRDATTESRSLLPQNEKISSLPEDGLSEDLCENEHISRVRKDASTNTGNNTNEPERKPTILPRGPGSVPEGAEQLNNEIQISPCSVTLVDIKNENASVSLHGNQQTQARTKQNEDCEVIVLSNDNSDGEDNFSEASTLFPSQPAPAYSRKPPTQRTYRRGETNVPYTCNPIPVDMEAGESLASPTNQIRQPGRRRERHGNYLIRNIKIPIKTSWKTALARRVNPSSQQGRRRGWRIPRDDNADFGGTELPVRCGNVEGTLHKEKFKQGIYVKSIKSQTGRWLNPMEFEIEGNREKSKHWRQSIRCKGWTLRELIKKGVLQNPPRTKKEILPNPRRTKRKLGNPKACKVCHKPRKLYPCATCKEFYHKNCHIPPVEEKSSPWRCAFCKRKKQLRRQHTQECHKEAEVLKRKMSPEEQLKCELILLTIYCYPKSGFFNPKPKQKKTDFPALQEHMWLNKIKNLLNKKAYHLVQHFVEDMRLIFHNHSIFYKSRFKNLGIRVGNKFEKTFKKIFSIQETSKQHPPRTHSSDPSMTRPSSSRQHDAQRVYVDSLPHSRL